MEYIALDDFLESADMFKTETLIVDGRIVQFNGSDAKAVIKYLERLGYNVCLTKRQEYQEE